MNTLVGKTTNEKNERDPYSLWCNICMWRMNGKCQDIKLRTALMKSDLRSLLSLRVLASPPLVVIAIYLELPRDVILLQISDVSSYYTVTFSFQCPHTNIKSTLVSFGWVIIYGDVINLRHSVIGTRTWYVVIVLQGVF